MRRPLRAALLSVSLAWIACGDDGALPPAVGPSDAGDVDGAVREDAAGLDGGADTPTASTCRDRLVAASIVDPTSAVEVVVASDPPAPGGIFDPSVVYPAGAPGGAMAYSAVTAKDDIATRIALSSDEGATWTFVAQANSAAPTPSGNLISEVSSLVFDPLDPDAQRRWKLWSHRYLAKGDELSYAIGHIALQTAPDVTGPWTSPVANVGWQGPNAFSSDGAVFVAQDVPALADCVAFTEPSGLALPQGGLALSLGCVSGPPFTIRVVLLLSADHGRSWAYAGVLFPAADAPCLGRSPGVERVNAADLFGAGGKAWVFATPEHPTLGYRGCALVEIADLATATIARDDAGAPVVTKLLSPPTDQFSGACAYAEGAKKATALISIAFLGQARPFRIYRSGVTVP